MANSTTLRHLAPSVLALLVGAGSIACSKAESKPGQTTDKPAAAEQASPAKPAKSPEKKAPAGDTVKVAQKGAKIDPPVKPEKIPEGAWMCDMGTVHYAALEKGDGKCPVCKMGLEQKGAADSAGHKH